MGLITAEAHVRAADGRGNVKTLQRYAWKSSSQSFANKLWAKIHIRFGRARREMVLAWLREVCSGCSYALRRQFTVRSHETKFAKRGGGLISPLKREEGFQENECFLASSSLPCATLCMTPCNFFGRKTEGRREGDHFLRYAAHLETKEEEEEKMLQNVASISSSGEGRIRGWDG